ncbi:MAG: S8 family serine peptidase [Myxococcales bacterium]|nr:S8 family serine peptidase [Myxococcales bacterium]
MKRSLVTVAAGGILALAIAPGAWAGEIAPDLAAILAAAPRGAPIEVVVHMRDDSVEKALMPRGRRHRREIVETLRRRAAVTQADLLSVLDRERRAGHVLRYEAFWGINAVALTANRALIERIAGRDDVEEVVYDEVIQLPEPPDVPGAQPKSAGTELNLANVPAVWDDFGITGAGVVVANMDSGVYYSHPALGPKWRGGTNSWFDGTGGSSSTPVDPRGHGTETMGLILAGDGNAGGSSNDIGAAYNATWIAGRIFNASGSSTTSGVHSVFQWFMDPDGDPLTDDLPDVINNSWSRTSDGCQTEYRSDVIALNNLGVIQVFSAGNTGPDVGSQHSPGNYGYGVSVGATNSSRNIASYSGRGPNPCTGDIGPEIVAMGSGTRSTNNSGGYSSGLNGTSFSTPTVTGIVGLLVEANPDITPEEVRQLLKDTAVDLGDAGPDNKYGWGFVDAYAAVQAVYDPTPRLEVYTSVLDDTGALCGGNGVLDPGERVRLGVALYNRGVTGATGIVATLSTTEPNVTILDASATYPDIAGRASAAPLDSFEFEVSADQAPFSRITLTLDMTSNEGSWREDVSFVVEGGAYVADDTVAFDWIDASGGTDLGLGNNNASTQAISFDFPYFGEIFNQITVGSNGLLAVVTGGVGGASSNAVIPAAANPNGVIAPLWDDLDMSGGIATVVEVGEAPDRKFVAQWTGAAHYGTLDPGLVAFEAVLEEGGGVQFNYADVIFDDPQWDGGKSATVGVESPDGTHGTQYSRNQAVLSDFSSIRFTFQACEAVCTDDDGDGFATEGGYCGPVDCDDTNADVNPGAAEVCNAIDDNCDGTVDEAADDDGDGYDVLCGQDCDDTNADVNPGALEACNAIDDDCDGAVDEAADADGDGYDVLCGEDCDDTDADVNPGATEITGNGIDDDCDPATPDVVPGCAPVGSRGGVAASSALVLYGFAIAGFLTRRRTRGAG